jgi:hypothetical protein
MNYKNKLRTLRQLLKLVEEDYFEPFFKDWYASNKEAKLIVKNFLEARIIELETDKSY